METDEFKSLPTDFFEADARRPDPKWLLLLGAVCIAASVAVGTWLLIGF